MAWRIDFTRNADKAMRKLDKGVAARVFDELDEIAKLEDPRSRGKALTGNLAGVWRYRVGDYRILCDINDGRLVILVVEARIEGNNFDIGQLEQLSTKDKQDMLFELVGFIMCERFETINDFTAAALREFPEQYREIIVGYNSILERYCRGNYLNAERKRKCVEQSGAKE